ncbi:unnamed protein product [Thelazia callipaeda]|uniref:Synaptogyrin n=1 Tax=Thelazia callipaeda TaxID=103827 RepID=A0A0N5D5P4_THECL|nr:unnamed protein product [Thelazia callipaeda]
MEGFRAYGAGMAGGRFQFGVFLRKPTVIFRIIAIVFGLAQWIAVSGGGWYVPKNGSGEICLYGKSSSTCSFGSAMGFFAILGALGLLFLDAKFEKISSVPSRKRAVVTDLTISASFASLFLITFFTLWSKYGELDISEPYDGGTAKSAIFFALFSFIAWIGAAFFVWRRYEEGVITNFVPSYEQDFTNEVQIGPDYSYGGDSDIGAIGHGDNNAYQNAPFTALNTAESPVDISRSYQGY